MIGRGVPVALAAAAALLALPSLTAGAPQSACGSGAYGPPGYAYAGHASARVASGVRATITQLRAPTVEAGHAAAWVGVGGPNTGRRGESMWLQVGLAALPGVKAMLYAEVQRPGRDAQFVLLARRIAVGERHDVAVIEVAGRRGVWRIWLDGRPVTEPITLQGSHRLWKPIVTAETWNGGTPACNRFGFRFDDVRVATVTDGSWRPFQPGFTFRDRGHVVRPSRPTVGGRRAPASNSHPAYAFDAASV